MEPCDRCSCESLVVGVEARDAITKLQEIGCPEIGCCSRLIGALDGKGILAVTTWHGELRTLRIPFKKA